jgi:hypothetical protein
METHVQFLPALEMMHWCLRFGQGRYKNLPVELVRMIAPYVSKPLRERVAQKLAVASCCFKNECSIFDHADRTRLLQMYHFCMAEMSLRTHGPYSLKDPTDAKLKSAFENRSFSNYIDVKPHTRRTASPGSRE